MHIAHWHLGVFISMAGEVADPDSNRELVQAYKLILPHLLSVVSEAIKNRPRPIS